MAGPKRKPPTIAERLGCCFWADFVMPPIVRTLERSGHLPALLAKEQQRREQTISRRNPFRIYEPEPQDVFVMTYPKSGTNWILQIAFQLIHHGQGEFDHIHSVVPWPDAVLNSWTMRNYAISTDYATDWKTAPEPIRLIKTHLNWEHVCYSKQARYIAVVRDPKDIFVSYYFFIRENFLGGLMPSVEAMYQSLLAGYLLGAGSWPVNAAGYWAQRNRANVLVLLFAEMKRDLEGTVRRVADFLDIRVSDAVIREVCRKSSFGYMKSIDQRFAPYRGAPWRKRAQMLRKGEQGASAELLSREQQAEIDSVMAAELLRLGSDLPYDELCGDPRRRKRE